jgi:uncharacterized phiE125 gp8 family phage protein
VGTLETTIAPLFLPVSLVEARDQCRLGDDNSFDPMLLRHIAAATDDVERHTGITIASRTLLLRLDGFPSCEMDLQTYPVQSITSIKYDDTGNVEQTLAGSEYYLRAGGMTPIVAPTTYWPTCYAKYGAVRVTFVAGYATAEDMPADIKHAILLRVFDYFNNPAELVAGASVLAITGKYRRMR